MRRNRWLIALAAVGIHICIGSVYAWSVLTKPVMAAMGLTLSETTWAFSLAILFLGMSAGFLGGFVERIGPSRSGLVSALFLRHRTFGDSACRAHALIGAPLPFLRMHRRHRPWHRIHHAGFHTRQMVPAPQRLCDRPGNHGIRICRTDRRPGHALAR